MEYDETKIPKSDAVMLNVLIKLGPNGIIIIKSMIFTKLMAAKVNSMILSVFVIFFCHWSRTSSR
jgi:hypothetical protein